MVAGVTPRVRTTTSNLGHLMAFIRALEWALVDPDTRGQPVCVRYESEYAANVCTGVWRAKKHREAVQYGRGLWAQLKRALGGKLWMQHSGRSSFGYRFTEQAYALAVGGQQGTHKCERHVGVNVGRAPRDTRNGHRGTKRARPGVRAGDTGGGR